MGEDAIAANSLTIKKAPIGLAALALVGPSFVWAAEYIGSGEVVIATRTGAILGMTVLWAVVLGVFLTALQAIWVGVGLFVVMPKMLSKEAYEVLKPNWIFAAGLLVTFAFFGYLCVMRIPATLAQLFGAG